MHRIAEALRVSVLLCAVITPVCLYAEENAAPQAGARAMTQWPSSDPTDDEQQVLELINRARSNPNAEAVRLSLSSITEGLKPSDVPLVGPRPPLAMNPKLLAAARAHSQDMWTHNKFDHIDSAGHDPYFRINAAGYIGNPEGENIAAGQDFSAAQLEDGLMIDKDVPERGHRVNLLDIVTPPFFREIGVGFYHGATSNTYGNNFLTQDFGTDADGPFLVGVVYNDKNGNGFYDPGEGIAGVSVMPNSGGFFAVTSTSGGYAFPVATNSSLTLTFSGASLPAAVTASATVNADNVKLDLKSGHPDSGGGGGGGVSLTATDTDKDGFPDELEVALGTSPTNPADTPFGGSPATPVTLMLSKLSIKLNFAKTVGKDTVSVTGVLPVPANFSLVSASAVVDVGGIIKPAFKLDTKGKSPTGKGITDTFKLKVKAVQGIVQTAVPAAPFTLTLKSGTFQAFLTDEGLTNTTTTGTVMVKIPVIILFNNTLFSGSLTKTYTSVAMKSGRTK